MSDETVEQDERAPIIAPLVTGSVGGHLFRQAVPMAYGIVAIFGYSLVDTYFIAQLGTHELAAITFTGPVIGLIHGLTFGLGIGVASVISRGIGSGDHRQIRRVTTDSLLLGAIIVALLVIAGFATLTPLFSAMRADQDTLPLIREYMEIYYLGAMFLIVPMIGISAIRAAGDTRSVGRILIISGVVNIILDPILIFGWGPFPRLEMQGAALATVIAEIATFAITFYLLRKKQLIARTLPNWAETIASWKAVLHVGGPACATELVMPVVFFFITAMLASYGEEVVAGFGVASRIEMVAIIPMIALNSVIGPFVGQNFGAGRLDRVRDGVRKGVAFTVAYGLFCAGLLAATAGILSPLFDPNPEVIRVAKSYLYIVPICYGAVGSAFVMIAAFNALGHPRPSLVLNVGRMVFIYLPLAIFLGSWYGPTGIFLAAPLGNFLMVAAAGFWFRHIMKKLEAEQE